MELLISTNAIQSVREVWWDPKKVSAFDGKAGGFLTSFAPPAYEVEQITTRSTSVTQSAAAACPSLTLPAHPGRSGRGAAGNRGRR